MHQRGRGSDDVLELDDLGKKVLVSPLLSTGLKFSLVYSVLQTQIPEIRKGGSKRLNQAHELLFHEILSCSYCNAEQPELKPSLGSTAFRGEGFSWRLY